MTVCSIKTAHKKEGGAIAPAVRVDDRVGAAKRPATKLRVLAVIVSPAHREIVPAPANISV
jgi:hypothetical protein